MPDRLCCNGFTFQHGMGCKRTQPAIACFDNIKKKPNLKIHSKGKQNKQCTDPALGLSAEAPMHEGTEISKRWLRYFNTWGKKPHTNIKPPSHKKTHTTAILWKRRQLQTAELVLSSSWQLSGGWEAVFWYDAGLNIHFFQTVLLSSHFAMPPPTWAKTTSKYPLTDAEQFNKQAFPENSNPYSV